MQAHITTRWAAGRLVLAVALLAGAVSCSPGTLPGTPSAVVSGGGGAQYNGTITYTPLSGAHTISTTANGLQLSLVMSADGQMSATFQTTQNNGSLSGEVLGTLAEGFLDATLLVSLRAQAPGGTPVVCEGRGEVFGRLSGVNMSWSSSSIVFDNCADLVVTAQAQAVAVSPIPARTGNRANVVVVVPGGTSVARGVCGTGRDGYPFVLEVRETAGIAVTFDPTFRVEERSRVQTTASETFDMPFTSMAGGNRLVYSACATVDASTYQAFFSGTDANGHTFRVSSPVVRFDVEREGF